MLGFSIGFRKFVNIVEKCIEGIDMKDREVNKKVNELLREICENEEEEMEEQS